MCDDYTVHTFAGGGYLHHLRGVPAVLLHALPDLPGPPDPAATHQLPATHQRGGEFGNHLAAGSWRLFFISVLGCVWHAARHTLQVSLPYHIIF